MPFFPSLSPVMGSPCRQAGRQNGGGSRRRKNHFVLLERFSARLLAVQIVRTLIAVGPGSYEILRRIIFFADCRSFLASICLSSLSLSLSLSLSDVCVYVYVCFTPKSLSCCQCPNFSDCGSLNFCSHWNSARLSVCCFLGLIDCEAAFVF